MKKFILGILTIILFIPVCESLSELICGRMEIIKGNNILKVLKINEEIYKIQNKEENISTNVMGFQYTPEDQYEDEEYY